MKIKPSVRWAGLGPISQVVARVVQTRQPSVLVVSLPGSGSSWVGEALGNSSSAAYLREPLTQPHLTSGGQEAVFQVNDNPPAGYARHAALAFAGLPRFSTTVVKAPQQWRLAQRAQRRIVVKEVNPLALSWLMQQFRLRVVFLVRHPMAVAARARRLGFWPGEGAHIWEEQGRFQAAALHGALGHLAGYTDKCIVQYENLCADPLAEFRRLYDYCELAWDERSENDIRAHSDGGDRSRPYDTRRDSRSMIGAWRSEVSAEETQRLRAGFAACELPWYQDEQAW